MEVQITKLVLELELKLLRDKILQLCIYKLLLWELQVRGHY